MSVSTRRYVISIIALVIIVLVFRYVLKINDFINALVALTIGAYFGFITGRDKTEIFFYHTSRFRFNRNIKKQIKKYEKEKDFLGFTNDIKSLCKKYFNKKCLDRNFIASSNEDECLALMIALQMEKEPFNISKDLGAESFRNIAQKAAKSKMYRDILLIESLKGIKCQVGSNFFNMDDKDYSIGDQLKKHSDHFFSNKLLDADQDDLIVFSTTSQISADIIKVITHHQRNIAKVSFFICSPFVKKHEAIINMRSEYQNPKFTTPVGQFIENNEGEVNSKLDIVRRALKITSSIKKIVSATEEKRINLDLFLFKKEYPGIKVKMLVKQKYMQLQPGVLSYANNLYRYGVDSDSAEPFGIVLSSVNSFKNDKFLIEPLLLEVSDINDFELKVISELCLWLLENGITSEDINSYQEKLNSSIDDEKSNHWLKLIAFSLAKSRQFVVGNVSVFNRLIEDSLEKKDDKTNSKDIFSGQKNRGGIYHITVAVLFKDNDEYLIIKKSDPAYDEKYSIVAGHLDNNESANQAVVREVKEELNISLKTTNLVTIEKGVPDKCRYGAENHDWYVFSSEEIKKDSEILYDKSEIDSIEWMSKEKIKSNKENLTQGAYLIFERMGFFND